MAGFPYYNDTSENQSNDIRFSDNVTLSLKWVTFGFIIALSFIPTNVFAEEIPAELAKLLVENPVNGTVKQKAAANGLAILACVKAAQCGKQASDAFGTKLGQKVTEHASKSNPVTVVTIVGCSVAFGWCAGQIADRAIRRAL